MILGGGLYENSGCVLFFTWAVSFSFFSCFFYSATAIETGTSTAVWDAATTDNSQPVHTAPR